SDAAPESGLPNAGPAGRPQLILTPHPGEAARLLSCSTKEIQRDRPGAVKAMAQKYHAVAVLKGAGTLVTTPEGQTYTNTTGNPGMATGGSGDVLSGITGSLAAQGLSAEEAAVAAVYVHGLAGDIMAGVLGEYGLTAGDLPEGAALALRQITKVQLDQSSF
ncbi:MAG: NAD(P)H-hydrate dehydratase, partial [Firmicutes bacterium]|nr:NAD(P)H-hydrate dehydratase [Bacillota bacterium]